MSILLVPRVTQIVLLQELWISRVLFYHDLRLRLFKKVNVKEVHYMHDTDILAWLFKYRTFVIDDFIEKAWAKNMSIYI